MGRVPLILCALVGGAGSSVASLSGLVAAWGRDFVVSPFEPEPMMVATMTEKSTGDTFKVVKMPDGRVMALVPMAKLAMMPMTDAMAMTK